MQTRFLALVLLVGVSVTLVFASVAGARGDTHRAVPHVTLLTGAAEVDAQGNPNQGDPNGIGVAAVVLFPKTDTVCWRIAVRGIERPIVGAHIHNAPAGSNGPIVVDFQAQLHGCTVVDSWLMDALLAHPENYYVNVHTSEFPAGAVRGQLA